MRPSDKKLIDNARQGIRTHLKATHELVIDSDHNNGNLLYVIPIYVSSVGREHGVHQFPAFPRFHRHPNGGTNESKAILAVAAITIFNIILI